MPISDPVRCVGATADGDKKSDILLLTPAAPKNDSPRAVADPRFRAAYRPPSSPSRRLECASVEPSLAVRMLTYRHAGDARVSKHQATRSEAGATSAASRTSHSPRVNAHPDLFVQQREV